MASETEIANLALGHLGIGKEIADLDTERSSEAAACRRFYDISRDATLRDFSWPFATKFDDLALIEEDPTTEWAYAYVYPPDCLMIRRILSGTRNDTRQSRVPYKIAQGDSGLVVYTDAEDAVLEYTVKAEDPTIYPADFKMAMAFRLAVYIAPKVTGGDPFKVGERCFAMYNMEITRAKASVINEEQAEEEVDSQFIRARE